LDETTKNYEELYDEPLFFGDSLEEAKRRRAMLTYDEKGKVAHTDWEISEIIML